MAAAFFFFLVVALAVVFVDVAAGTVAEPTGELKAQYFVVPKERTKLEHRTAQTDASLEYWRRKASRLSPTGLGKIESNSDTKLPQFGIGDLERRISDAAEMGGTQTKTELRIGPLLLHERSGDPPYDGEVWSWSPAELNRVAEGFYAHWLKLAGLA